jgi:hypothetical protein
MRPNLTPLPPVQNPTTESTAMPISDASKQAKVPQLVKDLQAVCEELADGKSRFEDILQQINDLEIGSFGTTYDAKIKATAGLGHVDGGMVDWTVGKLTELNAWWIATGQGRMAAINNLRTGAS